MSFIIAAQFVQMMYEVAHERPGQMHNKQAHEPELMGV